MTWAASLGDRSENADYQYNKKRLREIDRRVRYLTKCLEQLRIVDYSPQQDGKVFFGAWVEVENDEGVIKRFRIVGYDEIFGQKDYISIDSPMARALLAQVVGSGAVMNDLALQVGQVNAVKVGQVQFADTGSSQVQRDRRAKPAQADNQHTTVFQLQLAVDIDLLQQDLSAIAQQLLVGQHGRRPNVMRSWPPRSLRLSTAAKPASCNSWRTDAA